MGSKYSFNNNRESTNIHELSTSLGKSPNSGATKKYETKEVNSVIREERRVYRATLTVSKKKLVCFHVS